MSHMNSNKKNTSQGRARKSKARGNRQSLSSSYTNSNANNGSLNASANQLQRIFNTRSLVFRNAEVFPQHLRTTLSYYEQVNYTAVTTPQLYVFRGNSPYDPDQTGTGSQPVGYDNLATFYSNYYSIGSKITVRYRNASTVPLQIALSPCAATNTVSNFDQSQSYPHTVNSIADGITNGGNSFSYITNAVSTLEFFNTPFDLDYTSLVTTSPASQWYWLINLQSFDQATAISCSIQITISYDVVFFSRKFVNLS